MDATGQADAAQTTSQRECVAAAEPPVSKRQELTPSDSAGVEGMVPVAPHLLRLPNEMLVRLVSYLDARSVLCLRLTCQRLHMVASDPINWSTVSWEANFGDAAGLEVALKLARDVLKHVSVCGWRSPMSDCIDQLARCCHLRSVSLSGVAYTEKQLLDILSLPSLTVVS